MKTTIKQRIFVAIGCVFLALGALGVVVPLLPSFPFLLIATWCFMRGSARFHRWFVQTKLYRENIQSYVESRTLTRKAKIRASISLTLIMGVSCFFMMRKSLVIPCVILFVIWAGHLIYFTWFVPNAEACPEV